LNHVKLLGLSGGKISALEYHLALIFGVEVGILENSIGEGSRLLQDPAWQEHEGETKPITITKVRNIFSNIQSYIQFK